jgi:tetratricopeptide (TPR) repeat protein
MDYRFCKQLGDAYLAKLDYEGAVDSYSRAIKIAPGSFVSACLLGSFQKRDGSFARSFLWSSLGEAYKGSGDHDAANEMYNSVIFQYLSAMEDGTNTLMWRPQESNPYWGDFDIYSHQCLPDSQIWSALGEVYQAKGNRREAIGAFRKALESWPTDSRIQEDCRWNPPENNRWILPENNQWILPENNRWILPENNQWIQEKVRDLETLESDDGIIPSHVILPDMPQLSAPITATTADSGVGG